MNAYANKNGVKLLALVAILAMVVCAFAAIMPASQTDAAPGDEPTYIHGGITSEQKYENGTEVIIDGNLTIPSGTGLTIAGDFTVNEGVTVTIQAGGYLIFNSTANVTINGSIVATGANPLDPDNVETDAVDGTYYPSIINKVAVNTDDDYFIVNGSITLERGAAMSNTTDAFVTSSGLATETGLTDANNGMIVLTSGASLNVTKRSNDVSMIENQNILLNEGATFTLNGHVGNVYVQSTGNASYRTVAAVSLNAGGLIAYTDMGRTTSNLTFSVTNEATSAVAINNDEQRYTVRQYVLNVDGEVAATDTLATYVGGLADASTKVGSASVNPLGYCLYFNPVENENATANIILPKVSVSGSLTVASNSTVTIATGSHVDVSGTVTLSYSSSDNTAAKANINGALHVTGTVIATYTGNNLTSTPSNGSDIIYVEDGSIQITDASDTFNASSLRIWGTYYTVDGATTNDDPVIYIMNFADAIAAATAAEVEEVYVCAFGAQNRSTSDYAVANGAYVIDSEVTIPGFMELYIQNALVVGENGTLILEEGSIVTINTSTTNKAIIWNNGKVIDYGGAMEDYEGETASYDPDLRGAEVAYDRFYFAYEVKKTTDTDTEYYVTYTSLAIAISESQAGETIELNGKVTITEDLIIPTDVTVVTDDAITSGNEALEVNGATLTINGTLELSNAGQQVAVTDNTNNNRDGSIVLNGIIANADENTFTDGNGGTYTVAGAYFNATIGDDESARDYVTTVAIAGENSTSVEGTEGITIKGSVAAGTVSFTEGENTDLTVTVVGTITSGNITLVNADLDVTNGTITGTVTSEVTSGTSTMEFIRVSGVKVVIASDDNGETITTSMEFSGTTLKGNATVSAGEVVLDGTMTVGTYTAGRNGVSADYAILTIGNGATLSVLNGAQLTVASYASTVRDYAGLVVDGTLAIDKGTLEVTASNAGVDAGQVNINGTMTIDGKDQNIDGIINVTGDVTVADNYKMTVYRMYVGDDEGASGTVTGSVDLDSTNSGIIIAYPNADMTNAAVSVNPDGTVLANETVFYINGNEYMTSYALDSTTFGSIMDSPVSLVGYKEVPTTGWYDNAEMTGDNIESTDLIDDLTAAYAHADPSQALVYVSVGSNMSVFIDDVRYSNGSIVALDVGTHTVSVQVNPGYTGETSILFNSAAITGGAFEITPEMADDYGVVSDPTASDCVVLSITGNISIDTGSTGSSSDDGMGLTDYLLIILVVLIVIMAIMVAMRLMRS